MNPKAIHEAWYEGVQFRVNPKDGLQIFRDGIWKTIKPPVAQKPHKINYMKLKIDI